MNRGGGGCVDGVSVSGSGCSGGSLAGSSGCSGCSGGDVFPPLYLCLCGGVECGEVSKEHAILSHGDGQLTTTEEKETEATSRSMRTWRDTTDRTAIVANGSPSSFLSSQVISAVSPCCPSVRVSSAAERSRTGPASDARSACRTHCTEPEERETRVKEHIRIRARISRLPCGRVAGFRLRVLCGPASGARRRGPRTASADTRQSETDPLM